MKNLTESILQNLTESKETGKTGLYGTGNDQHKHTYLIDNKGNGKTTSTISVDGEQIENRVHNIKNRFIDTTNDHTHTMVSANRPESSNYNDLSEEN